MIALLEASRAGLFARRHLGANVGAGVVVAVVALPLAMAFAIASGARPEQGLYSAIVGGLLVSLLGGSRVQIAGPTGAFIAVLAGISARYGMAGLQAATLMAGVLMLATGAARLGGVIRFVPAPVIAGFTAGIGVIIFVGQWSDFLGLPRPAGEHFHQRVAQLVAALPGLQWPTVALGLTALAVVVAAPRIPVVRRVPAPLAAMLVATVAAWAWQRSGAATLGSAFGGFPPGWPSLRWPQFPLSQWPLLIGPAFAIAMLGSIESLLSAVVADGMTGTRHDADQELVGQGIANIVAPLFGGFAVTGAIARTATSVRNGATSPVAGIVHAVTLLAVLLALAPLAARIPLAALAAILVVVAWNMSDLPRCARMLRSAPTADKVILVVTFALTVFTDVVVAVNVGVLLAVLQFLRRMVEATRTRAVTADDLRADAAPRDLPAGVSVFEISGPMFFGATEDFERVLAQTHTEPRALVLRLRRVPFIDMTGLESLEGVLGKLRRRGVRVLLCEANERVLAKLAAARLSDDDDGASMTFDAALRLAGGSTVSPAPAATA